MRLPTLPLLAAATTAFALGAGPASAATTLYVSASAGSDPSCAAASQTTPFATLAGALRCAAAGSTIDVGAGSFAGGVTVPANVTIAGAGAGTVITGSTDIDNLAPAIRIPDGRTVTIRNVTIDGVGQIAQGIVAGSGRLTVANTTIKRTGAHTGAPGAAIQVKPSSGTATVSVTGSTLASNLGDHGGGAIYVTATNTTTPSTLSVVNSTLTGNDAGDGHGGGILVGQANLTARDDTVAGNTADGGGGVSKDMYPGTVSLRNTILAANTSFGPDDCEVLAARLVDGGHNIVGAGCPGLGDMVNGDQVGTPASPIDPVLGALASHGGQTQTMAPRLGSPAINAGDPAECRTASTDQRGTARNAASRLACDVGAHDTAGTPVQTLYVSAAAGTDPSCSAASQTTPFHTLAGALACASDGTTLKLGAGTFAGRFDVAHNVVLAGAGASTVIAGSPTAGDQTAAVTIEPRKVVVLRRLKVDGNGDQAPGVVAHSGILTLDAATITRTGAVGGASLLGAGLSVAPAAGTASDTTVYDSTIDHNVAQQRGGGILVKPEQSTTGANPPSRLAILNSTIADNTADSGDGGGIWVGNVAVTLRDSTIAGNDASWYGGGIRGYGDTGIAMTNTVLAGNTAYNGADCSSLLPKPLPSGGHNVVGQIGTDSGPGCQAFADGTSGDHVGTPASPIDAKLGALAANGGATQTMALLAGSPAIRAGSAADAAAWPIAGRDQRGSARNATARGASDAGAYDTGS